MGQQFSDRAAAAAALVILLRQRLAANRASMMLRTALHSAVPVHDRAAVRHALDALVAHGVLAMRGEYIGFTAKGRMFLAHVRRVREMQPTTYEQQNEDPSVLAALLEAIEEDERFDPREELESLPARLQSALTSPRRLSWTGLLFTVLALVALAVLAHSLRQ